MQLNWLTFVLELVNFAALTWVLSRILYRPVRDAIARRQAREAALVADAAKARAEAAALAAGADERIAAWAREGEARRTALEQELAGVRTERLGRLDDELHAAREADASARAHDAGEARANAESEAIHLAASFAGRLLGALAGPELHHRIVERFLDELPHLSAAMLETARANGAVADVRSAYPLEPAEEERLQRALATLLQAPVQMNVRAAPELICGVEVHVGAAALEANVRRELAFFAEVEHA